MPDNGANPSRDEISKLTNSNHAEYAHRWGMTHNVIDRSLVTGKCLNPRTSGFGNCSPYWNKIEMFRQWLNEPKNPNVHEEWRYYVDDDMLVANLLKDPHKAIDQLRNGKDTSVIVAEDVVNWQKWFFSDHDRHLSVNTGALIVRKDEQARDFIEKIWNLRNFEITNHPDPNCLTIGMCRSQFRCLHEQEAMTRALRNNPSLEGYSVTIVAPRDAASRSRGDLAINTFYRKGCFTGPDKNVFSYEPEDTRENPDGAYQEGDWLVQAAGVPITGKRFSSNNGICKDSPEIPITPVRLNMLQELSQKIKK